MRAAGRGKGIGAEKGAWRRQPGLMEQPRREKKGNLKRDKSLNAGSDPNWGETGRETGTSSRSTSSKDAPGLCCSLLDAVWGWKEEGNSPKKSRIWD